MLISGSQMVTIAVNMGRDGLPGGTNASSVGIRGMPTEKQKQKQKMKTKNKKHKDKLP